MVPHVVYRALPSSYSLPPVDGQYSKEGQPCRCYIPMLQKSSRLWSLKNNSTCLHPLNMNGYKQTGDKQKKSCHLAVQPSSQIHSKCLRASLPCLCMAHPPSMVVQVTTSWDGILMNNFQVSSMLPHFAYMSTKLFPTKTSDKRPLWTICSWTHLPSSSTTTLAHAFSTPTKVAELGHTGSCCCCQHSCSVFWPCQHFPYPNIMLFQVITSWDGILLNTLQASSMLPHFAYMSIKLVPTKTSDLQPLIWMSCSWISLLSSNAPKPANARIKEQKWIH